MRRITAPALVTIENRLGDAEVPAEPVPTATSMAFPSVLSIPYGVEEIVPELAQVVA